MARKDRKQKRLQKMGRPFGVGPGPELKDEPVLVPAPVLGTFELNDTAIVEATPEPQDESPIPEPMSEEVTPVEPSMPPVELESPPPLSEETAGRIATLEVERDRALADMADLSRRLETVSAQAEELERLRKLVEGLRVELVEYEALKSDLQSLCAENAKLSELLEQERARRDELRNKAEKLGRQESELVELQARVEELSAAWDPGAVAALNIECDALRRQNTALASFVAERDHQLEDLQRKLVESNPALIQSLRDRIEALQAENQELGNSLEKYKQHADNLSYNVQRMKQAADTERRYRELLSENASLKSELGSLKAQLSQFGAYKALYQKIQLENTELKQAIEAANESEKRRQEQGERVFDALRVTLENSEYHRPLGNRIRAWPGDAAVVKLVQDMAGKTGFVFTSTQIRWFLASIRSSRFVILKGFSGLGKTSLPIIFARAIGAPCEVVPVQPSWKSKVDLLGFYNHFDQRFLPTLFTKALLKAQLPAFQDRLFFIVLDEMNLSRVEYYFNDFNVKLEDLNDPAVELFENAALSVRLAPTGIGRYIRDGNRIAIPHNVVFVGTVNDDETTYAISDKIYDRAQVMDFQGLSSSGRGRVPTDKEAFDPLSFTSYQQAQTNMQPDPLIDMFLSLLNQELRRRFYANLSFRPRGQIQSFHRAYLTAEGQPSEALDLQMISKVLPKIRYSHRSNFADDLREFGEFLHKEWPYSGNGPTHTRAALELMKAQA